VNPADVLVEAGRLAAEGVPFVLATVVSVERPASARRGNRGLVTEDGELVGWVGGACSEPIVVREALRALADGEPRLLRIGPPGRVAEGAEANTVVAASTCASEGVVEVLVEPQLPDPLLVVLGGSPAAETLARLAAEVGWRVARELRQDADAVVVATMGHGDEDALAAALEAGTGYVGLVARLDLGPSTQAEIAVAVLAELVAWRHTRTVVPSVPDVAVDPVCGMEVAVGAAKETTVHEGATYYFCGAGCRSRFEADPARYLSVETP
jgi:xanthine dehydrogenase accessory factor